MTSIIEHRFIFQRTIVNIFLPAILNIIGLSAQKNRLFKTYNLVEK